MVILVMLVTTRLLHSQQLSPNYVNMTFYPAFHHFLPPLTTSLALSHNMGRTSRGVAGRERVGTAFHIMFCFKMSWKLFLNGYFFDAFPHLFC